MKTGGWVKKLFFSTKNFFSLFYTMYTLVNNFIFFTNLLAAAAAGLFHLFADATSRFCVVRTFAEILLPSAKPSIQFGKGFVAFDD